MRTWPPRLNPKIFLTAARELISDPKRYDFCPLRAILVHHASPENFMEMYVARAFFVYLFRPAKVKPTQHWWPRELNGPLLSLYLAAELASEVDYQLGADGMIEVFRECTAAREHQFEVGQRALLNRALQAENRPPISASLSERITHELRNL